MSLGTQRHRWDVEASSNSGMTDALWLGIVAWSPGTGPFGCRSWMDNIHLLALGRPLGTGPFGCRSWMDNIHLLALGRPLGTADFGTAAFGTADCL